MSGLSNTINSRRTVWGSSGRMVGFWILLAAAGWLFVPAASARAGRFRGNDTEGKAYLLVIPHLKFKNATLPAVVKYLKQISKKLDPRHVGVNFFLWLDPRIPAKSRPVITMDMSNIPLVEAVRYICMAARMQYKVERNAIVLADLSLPMDKMQTRFFRVNPALFGTYRTRRPFKPLTTISGDSNGNNNGNNGH